MSSLTNGDGSAGGAEDSAAGIKIPDDIPIPQIPRSLNIRAVTKEMVSYREAAATTGCRLAAHAFIWAPCDRETTFGTYKAAVMMHLRFDGTLGFPGGLIDENEGVLEGLMREMKEECNYCVQEQRPVTWDDYHSSRVVHGSQLVLHMFVVRLTLPQFEALEKNATSSADYGEEVFGTVRVPLYTMWNSYGGLPAFINNKFVGCAKQQLLMALFSCNLITDEQVTQLIDNANNMKLSPNRL